jgi:hypothetical protein
MVPTVYGAARTRLPPGQLATDRCEYAEVKPQPGGEPDMGGGSFESCCRESGEAVVMKLPAIADQAEALEQPSPLPVGRPSNPAHFSE